MRRIVNRITQHITSYYGWRIGFKLFHKGLDLRVYKDSPKTGKPYGKKLNVVLPERCKFKRSKYQKKWGWAYVFKGLESGVTHKFTHMETRFFQEDIEYTEGFAVGYTELTEYMKKKGYGDHVHWETWKNLKPFNPVKYLVKMDIKHNEKGVVV